MEPADPADGDGHVLASLAILEHVDVIGKILVGKVVLDLCIVSSEFLWIHNLVLQREGLKTGYEEHKLRRGRKRPWTPVELHSPLLHFRVAA
jgi:hypothetical protein